MCFNIVALSSLRMFKLQEKDIIQAGFRVSYSSIPQILSRLFLYIFSSDWNQSFLGSFELKKFVQTTFWGFIVG
jgi:hypothetical protein